VKKAFSLAEMTYEEAMEMSHFGAKVIYPPTLQPAFQKKIPLRIKNTFNRAFPGTLIKSAADAGNYLVKGISSINDISLINFQGSGMVGVSGVSSRLFGVLAANNINLISLHKLHLNTPSALPSIQQMPCWQKGSLRMNSKRRSRPEKSIASP
jgi:bifunctional aspartokinase / homoserine dehydrogenase 1